MGAQFSGLIQAYGYGVKHYFEHYFCNIVSINFIDGGNRSTRKKTLTYRKSVTNFIT